MAAIYEYGIFQIKVEKKSKLSNSNKNSTSDKIYFKSVKIMHKCVIIS